MYERSRSGISTFDLAALAERIGRAYNGAVRWELDLPVRRSGRAALTVRVSFVARSGATDRSRYERGVSGAFPASGGRTLVGELYRVTWELERKLSDEAEARARLDQGRLPGF